MPAFKLRWQSFQNQLAASSLSHDVPNSESRLTVFLMAVASGLQGLAPLGSMPNADGPNRDWLAIGVLRLPTPNTSFPTSELRILRSESSAKLRHELAQRDSSIVRLQENLRFSHTLPKTGPSASIKPCAPRCFHGHRGSASQLTCRTSDSNSLESAGS